MKYVSKGLVGTRKDKGGQPFFIPRKGDRAYEAFPLIKETDTDGFVFGAISNYLEPDEEDGCLFGDGYVQAPDGSRAGIVWQPGEVAKISKIMDPDEKRWGVYNLRFTHPIKKTSDLVNNFRESLPLLVNKYLEFKVLPLSQETILKIIDYQKAVKVWRPEEGLEEIIRRWFKIVNEYIKDPHYLIEEYLNDLATREMIQDIMPLLDKKSLEEVRGIMKYIDARFIDETVPSECVWGKASEVRHNWNRNNDWWYYRMPNKGQFNI